MIDFLNVLMIAVALSMDTFSLSLGIGTYNISRKKCLQISMTVGIMHFIMPYLGDMIGDKIVSFFALNSNLFLGCILLFIAGNLLWEMHKKEDTTEMDFSFLGIFLFAFGVSIDAFSTGLGLSAITKSKVAAMLIFSIVSFLFTMLGLAIGKFASKKLGKKANILGFLLLVILGVIHICK